MLKVNYAGWNQSKELLREEALKAEHPRTRERLMALYEISDGKSATKVAKQTQRNPQTVMSWVHQYNQQGLAALKYKRSGGKNPFFPQQSEKKLENKSRKHSQSQRSHPKKEKQNPDHAGL